MSCFCKNYEFLSHSLKPETDKIEVFETPLKILDNLFSRNLLHLGRFKFSKWFFGKSLGKHKNANCDYEPGSGLSSGSKP